MNKLALAIKIAAEAFVNKTDKGGKPYILHCLRVMQSMPAEDEDLQVIAVLHDIIEDTDTSWKTLLDYEFSERVLVAINTLTHRKHLPYMAYIENIATNEDAIIVKMADLVDNSNLLRLKEITQKDMDRVDKYEKAYRFLSKFE